MTNEEIRERLKPFISDEPSTWLKEAEKRHRQRWWRDPLVRPYIKWLTLKRFIKNAIDNRKIKTGKPDNI
jgi:plasmid rolling circle replication initiator protein Rep